MLPSVRQALTIAIEAEKTDRGLTWNEMPTAKVKETWINKKGEKIPNGWGTLRKIVNDETYFMQPKKQEKLLGWFGIECVNKYGIINLLNTGENE